MAPPPYQTHFSPGNDAGTLDFPCFMSPDPVSSHLDNAQAWVLNVSSNISNNVDTLNQPADMNYNQTQMQAVLSKIDELIHALRR